LLGKFKIFIFLCFISGLGFAQTDVLYFKDSDNSLTSKTIVEKEFIPIEKLILEPHSDASFWFKIPKSDVKETYIFKVKTNRVKFSKAFQNFKEIKPLEKERFLAYEFLRTNDLYIKVNSDFVSYFPFELNKELDSDFREKLIINLNGFFYGFIFLVIIYSLFYYSFFKDKTFLYYVFFLMSITLMFLLLDGTLVLFGLNSSQINILILLNYILISFYSSKFVNYFLNLEDVFPKLKYYTYTLGCFIIAFVVIFFFYNNHKIFIVLNVLVFLLLLTYWLTALILFEKNNFTKLLVFGFTILLFSGLDSFVFRNLGTSIFSTDGFNIKLGGLIQIIIFGFAILSREKLLRKKNNYMKKEIRNFSKILKDKKAKGNKHLNKEKLASLSIREREIFDLILQGKSNKEIATIANVSINTVKFHIKNIYDKLHIKNRKEALNLSVK
jgi:DNA-binding CsgD family transcriptional regulator